MFDTIKEHKLRMKKYLELENVNILAGAGTSYHLGAPVIRDIPDDLKPKCEAEVKRYFEEDANPSFEDLLNCLQADRYIKEKKGENTDTINKAITKMQNWLFENCNTEKNTTIHADYSSNEQLGRNKYHYHESLIKKLLQRPNNLKRANLFTTNYDMAFDYALDNLGVHYINGFMGVHNRCFRPEVYDYDLYYPGQSVTGKVHRAEKVIKYYKLHGSLSWLSTKPSVSNTYGIREIPLNDEFKPDTDNEIIVYPCVSKKSFTLDLPYSELFRQFAHAINQPQSVLFCIGYSFFDEHINDIIYQALSIPSFTLIIVNYSPSIDDASPIEELKLLKDKRIIILEQGDIDISSFIGFVENIMPDIYEEEEEEALAETMNKLFPDKKNKNAEKSPEDVAEDAAHSEYDTTDQLPGETDENDLPF